MHSQLNIIFCGSMRKRIILLSFRILSWLIIHDASWHSKGMCTASCFSSGQWISMRWRSCMKKLAQIGGIKQSHHTTLLCFFPGHINPECPLYIPFIYCFLRICSKFIFRRISIKICVSRMTWALLELHWYFL